eukprot:CAMPEP_0116572472 /NCGR_PEP_ID=MMETSP0397-20121206/18197_1 /TAXON_ID=216820 /ORGANISM="Cyclophora tenuis, Strain ECT3854" /LENGTH=193 /DNA_ID=CAMNT_0004100809 /DNA_START=256 /DNA_END=837 /DNA_ORIENTATION=-
MSTVLSSTFFFLTITSLMASVVAANTNTMDEPFCGYPYDQDPWQEGVPRDFCNLLATDQPTCEDNFFYGVFHCFWSNGSCQSDVPEGEEDCGIVTDEGICQTKTIIGFGRCVWRVPPTVHPTELPTQVPTWAPSTVPPTPNPTPNPTPFPTRRPRTPNPTARRTLPPTPDVREWGRPSGGTNKRIQCGKATRE